MEPCRKTETGRRFQIERLEERIAPEIAIDTGFSFQSRHFHPQIVDNFVFQTNPSGKITFGFRPGFF